MSKPTIPLEFLYVLLTPSEGVETIIRLRAALQEIIDLPRNRPNLWGGEAADEMRDIARRALGKEDEARAQGPDV